MKNKWIIPVVLFIVLVTAYAVRGMFQSRIELEVLTQGKIEETSTTQGVLIKKEQVNTVELLGTAEVYAKDGNRVANNEIIAMLYGTTEDEALIEELSSINKKINAIHASDADKSIYISDTMQMESEISNYVDEIIANASKNDFSALSKYKYKISMITAQKAIARGETVTTPAEELVVLQTRKNEIESSLGKSANIIAANMAGIFVEGRDGFEETMSPENIESFTPQTITDVIKGSKDGKIINDEKNYTYKIVDNFKYSVAVNLDEAMAEGLKVGNNVKVRFLDFSKDDIPAIVTHISEPDKEKMRTVVVECDNYVAGLLSQRAVNVDFVKSSISGYKIDVRYIHTVDNAVGIFIKRGAVMRFLPVNIEYSNEEEAIVTTANKSMPIKPYDEIVVAAPEFSDGKVIVSQ